MNEHAPIIVSVKSDLSSWFKGEAAHNVNNALTQICRSTVLHLPLALQNGISVEMQKITDVKVKGQLADCWSKIPKVFADDEGDLDAALNDSVGNVNEFLASPDFRRAISRKSTALTSSPENRALRSDRNVYFTNLYSNLLTHAKKVALIDSYAASNVISFDKTNRDGESTNWLLFEMLLSRGLEVEIHTVLPWTLGKDKLYDEEALKLLKSSVDSASKTWKTGKSKLTFFFYSKKTFPHDRYFVIDFQQATAPKINFGWGQGSEIFSSISGKLKKAPMNVFLPSGISEIWSELIRSDKPRIKKLEINF